MPKISVTTSNRQNKLVAKYKSIFKLQCYVETTKNESNKYIFFSDAKNMARDVHNILLKVIMEKGEMTEIKAADYIKRMESQKRYSSDVWS